MHTSQDSGPHYAAPDAADMLRAFLSFLNEEQVPYCAVGNTQTLGAEVPSDVDLVLPSGPLARLEPLLLRFCRNQPLQLVQIIQHEQTAFFCVLATTAPNDPPAFLQLDVCSDYFRNGRRFLSAAELLANRRRVRNGPVSFWMPAPSAAFIYYLIKKVDKRTLTPQHGTYLSSRWHEHPTAARRQLQRFWSLTDVQLLAEAADKNQWQQVAAALPHLQQSLHEHVPRSASMRWHELRRKVHRVLQPAGLFAALLGPDGSGKSSIIERVRTDVAPAFWNTTTMHLRPSLGERSDPTVAVPDPHGKPPRSASASVAKLAYYLLDYNVGYLVKVLPQLVQASLVIFDRYYHDLLVDPRRYRYGGTLHLVRSASRLLPQPDIFIILDAPPDVLHRRKQEVPLHETARQRQAYRMLAEMLPNSRLVDVAQPLDDVVRRVDHLLMHRMASRFDGTSLTNDHPDE